MERIVECVPNISEGRRKNVIEAVVNEVRSTPNVMLPVSYTHLTLPTRSAV